jgi:hypothetical protein
MAPSEASPRIRLRGQSPRSNGRAESALSAPCPRKHFGHGAATLDNRGQPVSVSGPSPYPMPGKMTMLPVCLQPPTSERHVRGPPG